MLMQLTTILVSRADKIYLSVTRILRGKNFAFESPKVNKQKHCYIPEDTLYLSQNSVHCIIKVLKTRNLKRKDKGMNVEGSHI